MICALLSFYDEPPDALHRAVTSLRLAAVDQLVCLDGAYALYPDGHPSSELEQHDAIKQAAAKQRIRCVVREPNTVWRGNEIEKRTRLFELGERVTEPTDWYLVIDADEEITQAPADLHAQLDDTPLDVAQITLHENGQTIQFPKFFRALRGLHCHANHYTYRTIDGRHLWGNARTMRLEPRLPIPDMHVVHHVGERAPERTQAARTYYAVRDEQRIETDFLGQARAA